MQMSKQRIFALFGFSLAVFSITLVGVFFTFTQVSLAVENGGNKQEIDELNDEISEKQDRIKELERTIDGYRDKIDEKRTEAVSLENQIGILDNYIAQVEADIELTEETIEKLRLEIDAFILDIEEKEEAIDRQKIILGELVRGIHQRGDRNMVEILARYDSFSDFYNDTQSLKTVESNLAQTTRGLVIVKDELDQKKNDSEDRKSSFEEMQDKLENRKEDLKEQIDHKERTLQDAESSEMEWRTHVANLKQIQRKVNGDITDIEREVRQRLESNTTIESDLPEYNGKLSWPTNSRYVTAYFYDADYPYRHVFEHNAIDIRAAHGTPLKAAASGYIARAKRCSSSSCYAYVMIVHSGGLSTVYGHMSSIIVSEDQYVSRGEVIGYSGATPGTVGAGPFTTGPHLHFEVRSNGIPVNPLHYLINDWE